MALVVVVAAALLAGCDWTSVQFGPAQTNYNPYEPALTEASVQHLTGVWSKSCTCAGGARVAGGLVYIVDGYTGTLPFTMTLRALDAATGADKWSAPLGQV